MKTYLLDANVLIALATPDHSLHSRARHWFRTLPRFATCPITQGALVRFHMRNAVNPNMARAKELLRRIAALPLHEFWPDDIGYLDAPEKGIVGHRQVTDAYLVALSRAHSGVLATLDEGIAAVHEGTYLIEPTSGA